MASGRFVKVDKDRFLAFIEAHREGLRGHLVTITYPEVMLFFEPGAVGSDDYAARARARGYDSPPPPSDAWVDRFDPEKFRIRKDCLEEGWTPRPAPPPSPPPPPPPLRYVVRDEHGAEVGRAASSADACILIGRAMPKGERATIEYDDDA